MLSILSNSLLTATRNPRWDVPAHWTNNGSPQKMHETERKEAEMRMQTAQLSKS